MARKPCYCTFVAGEFTYGVEALRVQEIIRARDLTRVPLVPWVVRGLINLRGRIVTVLDLRRLLGLPERPAESAPKNVVVRTGEGIVSLLVDEIGDVLEVEAEACEPPPETLAGVARHLIQGACKLPDGLLIILDVDKVTAVGSVNLPAPERHSI